MKSLYKSSEKLNRWFGHRRWRIFALCLPALLACLGLALVTGMVLSQRTSDLERRYDFLVKRALAVKNFELARVASLRGLDGAKNERDRAQWIFFLALALDGQGQKQASAALISEAAPLEPLGAGCVEAHLAVAQSMLVSTNLTGEGIRMALANPTNSLAVALRTVERHLLSAVAIEPDSLEANELLGRFYINTHQPAKARERLLKIYAAKPDTALLLAIDSDLENDSAGALQWAERALTAFEHNLLQTAPRYSSEDRLGLLRALIIEQRYTTYPVPQVTPRKPAATGPNVVPEDSPAMWLGIVRLLLLNGKYGSALETLEQRMIISSNSAYPPAIAQICTVLAQNAASESQGGGMSRLHFIQQGLTNAPENVELQLLLEQEANATNNAGQIAKKIRDQYVAGAKGKVAASWQYVLWADARLHGDMTNARKHLKTAHELLPEDPTINNDLAMDLASGSREDLERGLEIIQSVIDKYPYEPVFRDTRGQILVRLGRNQEALADLEFAATRLADSKDTKLVLSKVYAALGIVHQDNSSSAVLGRVRSLMSEGNNAAAVQTLEKALLEDPNPVYASAIADVCNTWAESLPLARQAERLRLIEKGLTQDPLNQKLRVLLLHAANATDDSRADAKKFLNQVVANAAGESAAEWHLLLGREARQKGDLASARQHLETAWGLAPQQTQIQLELAMVLAAGDHQDLERGMQLIDSVADKFPDSADNADFRNTRGRILAGLGRNAEAAEDLNFAVSRLDNPVEAVQTRRVYVKVLDALGKHQLAEQQRRLLGNP